MYSDQMYKRTNRIKTSLNDVEFDEWQAFCRSLKLQPATWLRDVVLEKIRESRAPVVSLNSRREDIKYSLAA